MISIIMPVYNTEIYLETALLSVLMQSFNDFELICIDDCSTDSSYEILKRYSSLDSRIKVYKNNANRGAAYCRNRGIEISKGKYIFFLDSDDWINVNTLELLYSIAESKNLQVLMFKFMTFWDDSNTFSIEPFYDMRFMDKYIGKVFNHMDLEPNSLFDIPGANCNKLYLKDFLIKINLKYPEGLMFEDTAVFFDYMVKAERVSLIGDYLYYRRRRKSSVMGNTGEKIFDSIIIAKDLIKVFLDDNNIYNRYKNGAINITFSFLKGRYNVINEELKEEFIQKTYLLIQDLENQYGLIKDIEENLNENNLDFYFKIMSENLYKCDLKTFTLSFKDKILISNMNITDDFLNVFLNDKEIYEIYKKTFLNYIFKKLEEKCIYCDNNVKEENFHKCKFIINKFYSEYDLYFDIMEYVNTNLINFFNQDNI